MDFRSSMTMSPRTNRRVPRLSLALALVFGLSSAPSARAHGGGGHGGGKGPGAGHHAAGGGQNPGSHGGHSSAWQDDATSINGPLTFNPYDLPAARFQRYMQHVFHHDQQGHP
jgi:hypothetical protein